MLSSKKKILDKFSIYTRDRKSNIIKYLELFIVLIC